MTIKCQNFQCKWDDYTTRYYANGELVLLQQTSIAIIWVYFPPDAFQPSLCSTDFKDIGWKNWDKINTGVALLQQAG